MYSELAITKEGWDKLTKEEQQKYADEHPHSNFSKAFNIIKLKKKYKEVKNKIEHLKLDSKKRISKSKKDSLLKSIKSNATYLKHIKEEIKELEELLKPSQNENKYIVPRPTNTQKVDYYNLPLPKENEYKNNAWLETEKLDKERWNLLKLKKSCKNKKEYNKIDEQLKLVFNKLEDNYLRYNSAIKNLNVKERRKDFYTTLDKCLEEGGNSSDIDKLYDIVSDSIGRLGKDYFLALVNTNKEYLKYIKTIKNNKDLKNKITPILALFDDTGSDFGFNSEEEQDRFLKSICENYNLDFFYYKRDLCVYLNDLSTRFVPFYTVHIGTNAQEYHDNSALACIGVTSLDMSFTSNKHFSYTEANTDLKDSYCCFTYGKDGEPRFKFTITHEYGHYIYNLATLSDLMFEYYIKRVYRDMNESGKMFDIGQYAASNEKEFFAECFNRYANGGNLPRACTIMIKKALDIIKNKLPTKNDIIKLINKHK